MPFAVLQNDVVVPTAEQLAPAFRAVAGLVASDAIHVARYQFGILAENLARAQAEALRVALAEQGVAASVADQATLPPLPVPKTTHRIDGLPEALTIYDGLGRPQPVTWDHVLMVAVGDVGYRQEKVQKRYVRVPNSLSKFAGVGGGRLEVEYERQGVDATSLILEILLDVEPWRCRASSDALQFQYLGERQQPKRMANFTAVVSDLLQLAPRALMNRGAAMLTQQGGKIMPYQNRLMFEKEMIWLLWWSGTGSRP